MQILQIQVEEQEGIYRKKPTDRSCMLLSKRTEGVTHDEIHRGHRWTTGSQDH